ncbi:TIGR02391 family protein [Malonomonas rubra DSM 5091]|uniref:TIGR02391 family protein n=1 Tax=Malonomonas rubra DSM 5091 TaxID=1122189 RepID=A0A1M6H2M8_MALRU|nr:TIGR02391 family protein [Malonomonas rubra]SHJ16435.1 TIGR02391 family protein [Malonomonas rubra DSM 5091]
MSVQQPFDPGTIEAISRVLGEAGSGTDISRYLQTNGLVDDSGESTKWRRLNSIFLRSQSTTKSANQILSFVQSYLVPTRFVGKRDEFENHRGELNAILILHGLEYGKEGLFRETVQAKTLDEAESRAQAVRNKLAPRNTHPEVYKYCQPELMQENYFHAVFEACKGLFQRIRDLSGVEADGANLVDRVFSVEKPFLAFNTLQTETERSEHKGFAQLLKGCAAAIRNPLAHGPKILWQGETDAADYLTLLSMLHRKLDQCVNVPQNKGVEVSK